MTKEQDEAIRKAIITEVGNIRTYCDELLMHSTQGTLDVGEIRGKIDGIHDALTDIEISLDADVSCSELERRLDVELRRMSGLLREES